MSADEPAAGEDASRDVVEALLAAVDLHRGGSVREAEEAYRTIIEADPDQSDALNFLGVLLHQTNRTEEGLALIRRSIEANPDHPDAHLNLGNLLKETGRDEEAVAAYRAALAIRPGYADAHYNIGVVAQDAGRLDESCAEFRAAIAVEPAHVLAHRQLAFALRAAGRHDEAAGEFDRWLGLQPEHPVATHLRAACSGRDVPARASVSYVRYVFDESAAQYDRDLERLDYRGPDLIRAALARAYPAPLARLDVLDAGCGTGLCGRILRPYAHRLVGADLSRRMLDAARKRRVYDELLAEELTALLKRRPAAFDLIVTADTLIYFGDLRPPLAAAAGALRIGGCLVFTVELAPGTDAAWRLEPTGRYRHGEAYVRGILEESGLDVRFAERATLRLEAGRPVEAVVFTARKVAFPKG